MNLEFMPAKGPANVEWELLLRAIAYNLVCLVMARAAELRNADADAAIDPTRVSFAYACRWPMLGAAGGTADVSQLRPPVKPRQERTWHLRRLKYRGRNFRVLTRQPAGQKAVAN